MTGRAEPGRTSTPRTVLDRRRRTTVGWVVTSLGLIVASTLFPFDFRLVQDGWTTIGRLDFDLRSSYVYEDMPLNLVLFVPFGFALAAALPRFGVRGSASRIVGLTTLVAFVLSYGLESVQGLLLLRFASFGDVLSNTAGALVGATFGVPLSEPVLERFTLGDGGRPRCLLRFALAAVVTAGIVVMTVELDHSAAPSDWDGTFPLLLGNETTADRPWNGTMTGFDISVPFDDPTGDTTRHLPLAGWTFSGGAEGSPPLERIAPADDDPFTPSGTPIDDDRWWRSEGPADAISAAVVEAGRFEVIVDVETASADQIGPARILSISDGVLTRNLMIGQTGTDLALRVRSDLLGHDGSDPELLVPDVFDPGVRQRIVVRYVDEVVQVGVDGAAPASHRLDLGAEVAVALWSFPQSIVWMRTGIVGEALIRTTFRAAALAPWGVLLAGLHSRWTRRRLVWSALFAAGMGVGFELLLVAALDGYPFEARWALVGALVVGAAAALFPCPSAAPNQPDRASDAGDAT